MRAVIYARVSSDPTREVRSVTSQLNECHTVIRRNGWTLTRDPFVDNDLSASRWRSKDRPAYAKLLAYLATGQADVLVIWSGSRAQRDLHDYLRLRDACADHGVLYCANGRLYDLSRTDDRFATGLDALLAEREADVIRDNVRRGLRTSAQAGRPPGRLLYGYIRQYSERGGLVGQVEHPEQAAVVREVFDRVNAGEPLTAVARSFNSRGIPTASGTEWTGVTVRRIATNPSYAGRRIFQGKVIGPGDWPPLVAGELFDEVHALVTNPARRLQRGTELRWQLSGAARCGVCEADSLGRPVRLRVSLSRRGHPAYACRRCSRIGCRADWVNDFVDTLIIARLRRPDAAAAFSPAGQHPAAAAARAEAARLRAGLDAFYVEAAANQLTAAAIAAVEQDRLRRIGEAEQRAKALSVPAVLRGMDPTDVADRWRVDVPVLQRREVILALADIVVDPRRDRGIRFDFDPRRLARSRWVGDSKTWGEHLGLTP